MDREFASKKKIQWGSEEEHRKRKGSEFRRNTKRGGAETRNRAPFGEALFRERRNRECVRGVSFREKISNKEESIGGRRQFHGAKELFLSDHYDVQSAHTIEGKCIVHSFKNYTKLENVGYMRTKPADKTSTGLCLLIRHKCMHACVQERCEKNVHACMHAA